MSSSHTVFHQRLKLYKDRGSSRVAVCKTTPAFLRRLFFTLHLLETTACRAEKNRARERKHAISPRQLIDHLGGSPSPATSPPVSPPSAPSKRTAPSIASPACLFKLVCGFLFGTGRSAPMGCRQRSRHGAARLAKEKTQDLQQCRTCWTFSPTVQHLGRLCVF